MIRFFTNRQLASGFKINLSLWKRWSREFLPPDPLGGLQYGVTRDYSIDDALTVFLGGCLVAELKFSIPEARQILQDLRPWFKGAGVYINGQIQQRFRSEYHQQIKEYLIYISPDADPSAGHPVFRYLIKGVILRRPIQGDHGGLKTEHYIEIEGPFGVGDRIQQDVLSLKILNITAVLNHFITRLDLGEKIFPIFSRHRRCQPSDPTTAGYQPGEGD